MIKRLANISKGIALLVMIFNCALFAAIDSVCELRKVFHHRSNTQDSRVELQPLELGSIVFYCDKHPAVEKKEIRGKNNRTQMKFFISQLEVLPSAQAMIADFNRIASASYTARITVDQQKKGIELIVDYDPMAVALSYDIFEAITHDKAVIFRVYNNKLLQALKKAQEQRMLRISYAKPTIIIDCGHGGSDTGTIGINKKAEKEIVLGIGKQLEKVLKDQGFTVCMTRKNDTFVPLDERTTNANSYGKSALFISLHANYASKPTMSGIETYCLASHLFDAQELATCLDIIEPVRNESYELSHSLASSVHGAILNQVHHAYPDVVNRQIKNAVAQVLVGTVMPSILIELGFLSNPEEACRLSSAHYQDLVIQGIYQGIKNFIAKHA